MCWLELSRNYLNLRFLAASDFFLRFTLGLSYCSLFLSSVRTPERWHCLLNLRSALSRDSFSFTLISAIVAFPPLAFCKENKFTKYYYTTKNRFCQVFFHKSVYFFEILCNYLTTMLTSLPGTQISLTTVLPSISEVILGLDFAASSICSLVASFATIIVPLSFPQI